MTVIACEQRSEGTTELPEVWRCDLCHCFHVRAGQVLLVFTPREFATFTNEVVECYSVQTLPSELADVDFLNSSTVAQSRNPLR